jgi:hypothetical protein
MKRRGRHQIKNDSNRDKAGGCSYSETTAGSFHNHAEELDAMSRQGIGVRPTLLSLSALGLLVTGQSVIALKAVADDPTADKPLVLEVSAGQYDRQNTLVSCQLTEAAQAWRGFRLVDATTRQPVAAQVDRSNPPRLSWIVAEPLKAGSTRRYLLTEQAPNLEQMPLVQVLRDDGTVRVDADRRRVLQYNLTEVPSDDPKEPAFRRSGFIHPVYDPAGGVVTDGMPPDHMHQHALMCAWVNATFEGRDVDFWNSAKHQGEVRHAALKDLCSGTVYGSFTANLEHVDLTAPGGPKTALLETWLVRVYARSGGYLFDVESSQSCACESPVTINKYHYGGMALRGAREWFGDKPCEFLTSKGNSRKDGNHTRPRWVEMSGDLAGDLGSHESGIAVFCHPDNFRAPQPVRLHPDKPYFCFAPMVLGTFTIEPGKPYVSTYRYYVHTGKPDAKVNDALWNDFADPPVVKIVTN